MKSLFNHINTLFNPDKKIIRQSEPPKEKRIITLEEYNNEIAKYKMPSEEETERFILLNLARHHSWYKHLTDKEEAPFYFFLDPNADIIITDFINGRYIIEKKFGRPDITPKLKWRYYTTARYTINFIKNKNGEYSNSNDIIRKHWLNNEGEPAILSDEILEKGKFMLSRFIHQSFKREGWGEKSLEYSSYHFDLARRLKIFLMGLTGVEIDKDKSFFLTGLFFKT